MREVRRVRQRAGEARRRGFVDDRLDLTVWQDDDGAIVSFQLGYDKPAAEHALGWHRGCGFAHAAVDDGEVTGRHKQAPLLVADGAVPWQRLYRELARRSRGIDPAVRNAVLAFLAAGA